MATTEQVGSSIEQVPFEALEALGRIFHEGEGKYGVGNWKDNPTPEYRLERLRHAIRHLFLFAEGDTSEKHLAKVLWFCATELYCESKYGPLRDTDVRERYPNAKHKPVDNPIHEPKTVRDKLVEEEFKKFMEAEQHRHSFLPEKSPVQLYNTQGGWGPYVKVSTPQIVPNKPLQFNHPNPPTVTMATYNQLQAQFEAFKATSAKEREALCNHINHLTNQIGAECQ